MDNRDKPHKTKHNYTPDHPQAAPSPLLAEYMKSENLDRKMSIQDARAWFYNLKDALSPYDRREERRHARR